MGNKKEAQLKTASAAAFLCALLLVDLLHDYLLLEKYFIIINVAWIAAVFLLLGILLWDMSNQNPADSHSIKSICIQYLLMSIMCKVGTRYVSKLHRILYKTRDHQESKLMDILTKNCQTEYGNLYHFDTITDRDMYRQTVPLVTYIDISVYINKIVDGEQGILTKDPVVYLAETSGTTGKNKVIPVTYDMKGPSAMKVGPLMYHFMHKCGKLDLQRVFILSYKSRTTLTRGGLYQGPVSAHMSRFVPFVICPREVYELQFEQTALHAHAVFALQETEVGHIEALMTTLVYSFWLYLEHNWHTVCNDIENGQLSVSSKEFKPDFEHVLKLQDMLIPNPSRASTLREIFSKGFSGVAKRIWPNLRFARMLNTGGFAHHANILRKHYMKGVKQVSQAHAASEGFLGFNLNEDAAKNTYTAMVDYGFMEFIEEANIHLSQPETLFCEQLELGKNYEIVLTTPMGLYRYRTGDVVQITEYTGQCPVYSFQYRVGQLLNLYWEKTPESVFYDCVESVVARSQNTYLVDYTVTEDVNTRDIIDCVSCCKRYVMFIELTRIDSNEEPVWTTTELNQFDEELISKFEMYKRFRENSSIGPMKVYQLQRDSFLKLKTLMISSSQTQQYKVPRVVRNKKYLKFLWDMRLNC